MSSRNILVLRTHLVLSLLFLCIPIAQAGFFDGEIAYEAGNYQQAFEEWRAAASRGDAPSMNALASLYEAGKGTARDPVLAYVYYDLAEVLGLGDAAASRTRIAGALSQKELNEAKALSADVKKTGTLPPPARAKTTSVEQTQSTQTTQTQPPPEPEPVITEVESGSTSTTTTTQPKLEVVYACDLRATWNDKGSGGKRDVALYDPLPLKGFSMIGGYAQSNYAQPSGCVAVVRASNPDLLAAPIKWKRIWADKGSGARLDGSIWAGVPPSPNYVCLGALGVKGYNAPKVHNYACVHTCLLSEVAAGNPVWTDEKTGSKSKVSIYSLPGTNAIVAFPSRRGPARLRDLNPAAGCVFQ